jgi:hypothetical protein
MAWVLRLVETEAGGPARGVDVLEINRPRDLGDLANLGLTLAEAKQLLARVQQAVSLRKPTIMQFCGRIAHPAAVGVTTRTGGFIRSQRYSAGWRCGFRDLAVPAVVIQLVVGFDRRRR